MGTQFILADAETPLGVNLSVVLFSAGLGQWKQVEEAPQVHVTNLKHRVAQKAAKLTQ